MYAHRRNSLNQLKVKCPSLATTGLARKLLVSGTSAQPASADLLKSIIVLEERTMWTKPDFTEMRFGFEITMYIGNR